MAAFGWRSLYYTPCALGVLWCGAWLALGADTPHNHPRVSPKELARITGAETPEATAVGSVQRREESAEGWRAMVRSPALWGQIFADFAQNYFFYVVFTFLPQFLSAALGTPLERFASAAGEKQERSSSSLRTVVAFCFCCERPFLLQPGPKC